MPPWPMEGTPWEAALSPAGKTSSQQGRPGMGTLAMGSSPSPEALRQAPCVLSGVPWSGPFELWGPFQPLSWWPCAVWAGGEGCRLGDLGEEPAPLDPGPLEVSTPPCAHRCGPSECQTVAGAAAWEVPTGLGERPPRSI